MRNDEIAFYSQLSKEKNFILELKPPKQSRFHFLTFIVILVIFFGNCPSKTYVISLSKFKESLDKCWLRILLYSREGVVCGGTVDDIAEIPSQNTCIIYNTVSPTRTRTLGQFLENL